MPGLNHKGPENMGPMTGRKMGRCANKNVQNQIFAGQGFGRGRNRGFCRGLGPNRRGLEALTNQQQNQATTQDLNLRAQALEQELESVRNELKNLPKE
jgi:hypothetical protein